MQCHRFSRKGAKAQRKTQSKSRRLSLRLCAFAGNLSLVFMLACSATAQTKPISERAAATAMTAALAEKGMASASATNH